VLVLSLFVLAPRVTEGAPILIPIDPASATLTGQFTLDNDVALFEFLLGPGSYTFSATTTSASTSFDPILTLFGPDFSIVTYLGPSNEPLRAEAFDFRPDTDVGIPVLTLAGSATYTLAVSQFGPFDGNFFDPVLNGFTQDAFPCFTFDPFAEGACVAGDPSMFGGQGAAGASFSIDLALAPVDTAAVPEPGTLSLIALGASVAFLRRRHKSNRNHRS
jgi:hypothetical protein